jgi:predicted NUDIX family phosphoesterase
MSKYAGEEVLVIPRGVLEEVGMFEGIRTENLDLALSRILSSDAGSFLDRAAAEEDPGHKQLIPYCIFRRGDRVLHYTRGKAGAENRLHARISVGVGGHINPVDTDGGKTGRAAYQAAVTREIEEELVINQPHEHRIIALINDESNAVGQVHLGVVHLIELATEQVFSREDALLDLGFSSLDELAGPMFERLETWSQFCVRHLKDGIS